MVCHERKPSKTHEYFDQQETQFANFPTDTEVKMNEHASKLGQTETRAGNTFRQMLLSSPRHGVRGR